VFAGDVDVGYHGTKATPMRTTWPPSHHLILNRLFTPGGIRMYPSDGP